MPETLTELLPWILPPLIGAIIGYITNAVAISMLFRPYREIRIFGIRIPFTPGIIPRQRTELAESIAVTVEAELLTESAVRRQTDRPEFKSSLEKGVSSFTDAFITMPFNRWGNYLPGGGDKAGDLARGFVSSVAFEHLVCGIISRAADTLLETRLSAFLGGEDTLQTAISSFIERLSDEGYLDRAEEGIENWARRQAEKGARISDVIGPEDIAAVSKILDGLYPPIFEGIIAFLKKDSTLDELEIRGRRFVHDVVDKLSGLQRLLITAGQYDRTIDENMDRIVVDLVAHIERAGRKEENRKNVIAFIEDEIRRLSNTGLGDSPEKQERFMLVLREIFRKLRDVFSDEKLRNAVSLRLSQMLLKEGRTVRSLIGAVPGLRREDVERYLSQVIIRMVRSVFFRDREPGVNNSVAEDLVSDFGHQSLEKLLVLGQEEKKKLDGYVTDWTISVINSKIPDILRSVDIHSMVVDRINSFDIVKMEKLILRVVKKHLRWITIFGGLLGALIGFAQILVNRFI